MTECEAIEKLRAYHKCQRLQVKGIYEDCNNKRCDDCDLCYMQGTTGEHMTAIGIAIQVLEKQIPKKPEYEADGYADGELVYDYAKCPICGHDYEYGINDWGCNYCSNCGQKLDWSDEE